MKRFKVFTVLAAVTSLLLLGSGFGSWYLNAEKDISETKDTNTKEVCYFWELNGDKFQKTKSFTSITKALKEAKRLEDNGDISKKITETSKWAKSFDYARETGSADGGTNSKNGNIYSKRGPYDFYQSFITDESSNIPKNIYAPVITIVVIPSSHFDEHDPNAAADNYTIDDGCVIPNNVTLAIPYEERRILEPDLYHELKKYSDMSANDSNDSVLEKGFNYYNGEGNRFVNDNASYAYKNNMDGRVACGTVDWNMTKLNKDDKWITKTLDFSDVNEEAVKKNRKTVVELKDNAELTIEERGTLLIGGNPDYGKKEVEFTIPAGMTTGSYAQLTLGKNSKIVSDGRILNYGYIKESKPNIGLHNNSSITVNKGYIQEPILLYDWRREYAETNFFLNIVGSGYGTDIKDPLVSIFDFPNIKPKTIIKLNGSLRGLTCVPGRTFNQVPYLFYVDIIDNNDKSLLKLDSGSISLTHDGNRNYTTLNDLESPGIQRMDIDGNLSFGNISLSMAGSEINLKNCPFPISYKMDINIKGGTTKFNKKAIFYPGSKMTINPKGNVIFQDDTFLFQENDANNYKNMSNKQTNSEGNEKVIVSNSYPHFDSYKGPQKNYGRAVLNVEGYLEIDDEFSGIIDCGAEGAKLVTGKTKTKRSWGKVVYDSGFKNESSVKVVNGSTILFVKDTGTRIKPDWYESKNKKGYAKIGKKTDSSEPGYSSDLESDTTYVGLYKNNQKWWAKQ